MKFKVPLVLAIFILGFSWMGPLSNWAEHAFFMHMLLHMSVVAVAAPLLALALSKLNHPVINYLGGFSPIVLSLLELVIVWGWHVPGAHHFARHTSMGFFLEQSSFFISGVWLWLAALGINIGMGIIGLLLTSMHMTLLGALLALAPRPLYSHHQGLGQLSALDDQHLGGVIMLLVGGIAYLLGGMFLAKKMLGEGAIKREQI